ncbi:TM2 domain-containing protein almondex-like [Daphnia carinata]|uniref:TM2 domain-containing protein almondex-like n=1 Tax=Daphnia carinata TaxID=120202 RepID=UPI00257F221A|nr:TM2 domain-containing protein almondex-like [Daphnia carinata]
MANVKFRFLPYLILCFIPNPIKAHEITSSAINQIGEACLQESCNTITEINVTTDSSNMDPSEQTTEMPSEEDISGETSNSSSTVGDSCHLLPVEFMRCDLNFTCIYGGLVNVSCETDHPCKGSKKFHKEMKCQYCYQTSAEDHSCNATGTYCNSAANPVQKYRSNCTAKSNVLCLGQRMFFKNIRCNWTSGYKWSTTLLLSITLGGFGADRFYLGHWQEGIGKLFSFGGAGVWTLIDVILVAVGYLKPADGSVYI